MKKQQKPNWFGGLLAMFILASAFLLTSQQVKEKLDQGKELDKHTIDSVLFKDFNPKLDISARDSIKTKRFSIDLPNTDSISYQYWKAPYFTNDSLTVEKALADILKNKENFMLERLESGEITNVSKGKNELAGDSLTVYKQAFEMLDEYSDNNQKYKKQQELREYRKQYQEELKQLVSSYNELNKQEEITQIEYEKQLAEIQKQLMSASYAGQKSMDMNLEMLDYLRSLEGGADLSNEDFSTARMELQSKKMLEKMEQLKAKLGAQPDPEVEKLLNATISAYQEQLRALEKAQYQQQLALKEKVQAREKKLQQMQTQLEVQKKRAEVMIQRERLMAIQKENEAALNNQEEAVEREAEIRDKLKAIDSDMIKLSSNDNLKPLIMAVTKGSKDTLRLTDLYGIEYEQVQDISVYKNEAARRLTSEKEAKNGVILLTVDKSTFQKLKRTVKKEVKEKSKKQGNKNRSGKAELKQSSPVFDKFDFIAFDLSNEGTPEMFWEMMQGVNRDLKIKFLVDEEVKSTWLLKNLKEVGLSNFVTLDVMKSEYVRRNTDYDIEGYDAIIHLKK